MFSLSLRWSIISLSGPWLIVLPVSFLLVFQISMLGMYGHEIATDLEGALCTKTTLTSKLTRIVFNLIIFWCLDALRRYTIFNESSAALWFNAFSAFHINIFIIWSASLLIFTVIHWVWQVTLRLCEQTLKHQVPRNIGHVNTVNNFLNFIMWFAYLIFLILHSCSVKLKQNRVIFYTFIHISFYNRILSVSGWKLI